MRKLRDKRLYWRGSTIWCRVPGPTGRVKRETTRCSDEQAASAFADRRERQYANPRHAAAAKETLEDSLNAYHEDLVRRRRSEDTKKIARQKTGHFVRLWGARMPLERVLGSLVLAYMDKRQSEGVEDLTIKMELRQLRQVLRIAKFRKVYFEDIDTVIPPYLNGSPKKKKRTPSFAELRALLAQFPDYRAAHLAWLAATGGRAKEGRSARRVDVDWATRLVELRGTKTEKSAGQVPITVITAPLLKWALDHAPGKDVLFRPWGKLHRDVAAACVRAGIPYLTPNDLRRAFGSWHRAAFMAAGNNEKTAAEMVSKLLRHTTDKLTQTTYADLDGAAIGAAIGNRLDGVSDLYALTAPTALGDLQPRDEVPEILVPPGEIESPTYALGKRSRSARSIGTKLGLLRAKGLPVTPADIGAVPDVYQSMETPAKDESEAPAEEPPRLPEAETHPSDRLAALNRDGVLKARSRVHAGDERGALAALASAILDGEELPS